MKERLAVSQIDNSTFGFFPFKHEKVHLLLNRRPQVHHFPPSHMKNVFLHEIFEKKDDGISSIRISSYAYPLCTQHPQTTTLTHCFNFFTISNTSEATNSTTTHVPTWLLGTWWQLISSIHVFKNWRIAFWFSIYVCVAILFSIVYFRFITTAHDAWEVWQTLFAITLFTFFSFFQNSCIFLPSYQARNERNH